MLFFLSLQDYFNITLGDGEKTIEDLDPVLPCPVADTNENTRNFFIRHKYTFSTLDKAKESSKALVQEMFKDIEQAAVTAQELH